MSDRYAAGVHVEAGLVAFTAVNAHRACNEWHQRDHRPEVHTVESVIRGDRWVASPLTPATYDATVELARSVSSIGGCRWRADVTDRR